MTGRPAALSAFALASTASVADSAMPPMRREIRARGAAAAPASTVRDWEAVCCVTLPSWHCEGTRRRRSVTVSGSTCGPPDAYTHYPVAECCRDPVCFGGTGPVHSVPRAVAQLAAHRSPKPAVGGSSPSCPAIRRRRPGGDPASHPGCGRVPDERPGESVTTTSASTGPKQRTGRVSRVRLFLRQVVAELKKVVRPTRNELLTYATVVLVFVVAVMSYVSVLDFGFGKLVLWVFGGS